MLRVKHDAHRVSAQRFELDAGDPLAGGEEHDGEFECGISESGHKFIERELMQQHFHRPAF